jgi:Tetratricopeptide repeat
MVRQLPAAAILAIAALIAPATGAATPDENPAIGKITLLNRAAIEQYGQHNLDEAQRLLDQALDLAASAGLLQHPVRARTFVTLGVVTAGGLKRRDVAVRLFRKALQIQPEIQLSAELATPEVQSAFDEAVQGLGAAPKPERPTGDLLVHEPVTAANRGDAITIAVTPDESLQTDRLVLAYRAAGAAAFSRANMQRQADGVFEGIIPPAATDRDRIAYYVEARDADGQVLASRGSLEDPLIIALAVPPVVARAVAVTEATRSPPPEPRLVVGLLAGMGAGWVSGTGEVTGYPSGAAGAAWSRLGHLAPEVGVFVTPRLLIAIQGRLQLVTGGSEYRPPEGPSSQCGGDGVCSPARGAFAGFAKAAWFFSGPRRALRPYASLSIGGGLVRHLVPLPGTTDCGPSRDQSCRDTLAMGPLLGGAGLGFHYRIAAPLHIVVAVEGLVGAPKVQAHLDVNAGLALLF